MRIAEISIQPKYIAPRPRGRTVESNIAQVARMKKKRIQDLLSENYKEVRMDIPPAFIKGNQQRPGKTVNSRRVLALKRSLANVFDDDTVGSSFHAQLGASPSKYPSKPRCVVCGYFGNITCIKCGGRTCGLKCIKGHQCV